MGDDADYIPVRDTSAMNYKKNTLNDEKGEYFILYFISHNHGFLHIHIVNHKYLKTSAFWCVAPLETWELLQDLEKWSVFVC